MKLTLQENKYLKEPILVISELVNEATFKIDHDKIELIALDPANVAMVVFKLLSSAFSEYEIEEPLELTVNLDQLKQVLKRINPDDTMTLELNENKLKIELKSKSTRVFNISLLNSEESLKKIPDLKFPLKIETSTLLFDEAIEDMGIVSDALILFAEKDKFGFEALGSLSSAKVEFNNDNVNKIEGDVNAKSKYSIEYLKKIIKSSKLADNVVIQFDKDYPLKLSYKILDKMLMEFILAPRVAND